MISSPRGTEMFHFPRFASMPYVFRHGWHPAMGAGLLHSETRGSRAACASPRTIAACRVLRRRLPPRHPPYAALRLPAKKTPADTPCMLSSAMSYAVKCLTAGSASLRGRYRLIDFKITSNLSPSKSFRCQRAGPLGAQTAQYGGTSAAPGGAFP